MKPRTPLQIKQSAVFALVLREARVRLGDRRLGLLWVLLEPMSHLLLFGLLFTLVRGDTVLGIPFPVFVLVGMAPFLLFRNTALRLMESPKANRALFAYKQIKPLDTFIARAVVEFCTTSAVYMLLVMGFAWYGFDMSIGAPVEWVLIIALGFLFSFGLGVCLALVAHAAPGSNVFIRMFFFPLYFISGVLMPATLLPTALLPLLLLNPFLHLLELIRAQVFVQYVPVEGVSVYYVIVVTVTLLYISLGAYRIRRFHLISTRNG